MHATLTVYYMDDAVMTYHGLAVRRFPMATTSSRAISICWRPSKRDRPFSDPLERPGGASMTEAEMMEALKSVDTPTITNVVATY